MVTEPGEAEVGRRIFRYLIEDQLTCRQITKRLNATGVPTPSGHNTVWQANTVRNILSNPAYQGRARYNYRQPGLPRYRKTEPRDLRNLKTGRHYRPESEWIWSESPALVSAEAFDKALLQLRRNAEAAELCQLLQRPETIPALHQLWVQAQAADVDGLGARQAQWEQRRQRLQRQQQRLLDA